MSPRINAVSLRSQAQCVCKPWGLESSLAHALYWVLLQ